MSRLIGGKSGSRSRSRATAPSTPGSIGSFIAAVDATKGTITFKPDQAASAGKARTAARQYGPVDRLFLSGSATSAGGVLSATVQLTSENDYALNDVRAVVTSISDTSVTIANADGQTNLNGTPREYWDHGSLDPAAPGGSPTPSVKLWSFNNPGAVSFTFRVTILANAWNYNVADSNPNSSVSFPDAMHGWMVGTGGKLLCTKDGGVTWEPQNVGTGSQLDGVYFVNQYDGWVVGTAGTIRRTGNGGRTWFTQHAGTTLNLRAVRFVGPTTGWIVGDDGLILKTTNAGQTWTPQVNPAGEVILYALDFVSADVGWVVGLNGTVMRTIDGGNTWSLQTTGSTEALLGVCARDATRAWVCGANGRILRTTNGGVNWTNQNSGAFQPLEDIFFINNTTGWAVGGSGMILKTTNGGDNWASTFIGASTGLFAVRFTDPSNGWVVGQSGTLLHSTDGGNTWSPRQQGAFRTHYAVDFPTRQHGWMVGESGLIRVTSDGGQTWSYQNGGTANTLHAVRFTDADNGWIVGQHGTILHTTNGGQAWTRQTSGVESREDPVSGDIIPGETLLGVDFIDPLHGCVVGTRGTILYTADGGTTWDRMLNPDPIQATLTSVDMVDADFIFACGHFGRILFAYDVSFLGAGGTWERLNVPYGEHLHAIKMVDANTGWVVGQNGRVLRTVDGGVIWDSQREEFGPERELYAADFFAIPLTTPVGQPQRYKYVGWAAGANGRMYRTTDGGTSWTQVKVGTIHTLRGMRFTDPDSGWVVGAFGTVQQLN
jgi:photosystem II stability/assembly factor-like uncharacterized protein